MLDLTVAVLSPHLDDAVLSVGAAIAAWGEPVRVITVLAGDPTWTSEPGPWDAVSGFRTAGEASAARREEDRRACAIVGAEPVWLPFGDEQYGRGADDDRIWSKVLDAVGEASILLVPGHPLRHRDHRWLHELAIARLPTGPRVGLYLEQPYALGRWVEPVWPGERRLVLVTLPAAERHRRAKRRACRAYASQRRQLAASHGTTPRGLERRLRRFERVHGGERVAWIGEGS